jgi:hypothetical protein
MTSEAKTLANRRNAQKSTGRLCHNGESTAISMPLVKQGAVLSASVVINRLYAIDFSLPNRLFLAAILSLARS